MKKLSLTSFTVSAIHALLVPISCVVRFFFGKTTRNFVEVCFFYLSLLYLR
jgi:hypothetical protein